MNLIKVDKSTSRVVNVEVWDSIPLETSEFIWYDTEGSIGMSYNPEDGSYYDQDAINDKWVEVREERNALLRASDYTQLADTHHTADKEAWQTYRQQLRDLTEDQSDPFNITWPERP